MSEHLDRALASIDAYLDHPTQEAGDHAYPTERGSRVDASCWRCRRSHLVLHDIGLCGPCRHHLLSGGLAPAVDVPTDLRAFVEAFEQASVAMQQIADVIRDAFEGWTGELAEIFSVLGDTLDDGRPSDPLAAVQWERDRRRAARDRGGITPPLRGPMNLGPMKGRR